MLDSTPTSCASGPRLPVLVGARRPKTEPQVVAEIAALAAVKPKLLGRFSAFGDDNYAAIDAQIEVLTTRLTRAQVDERFPENGTDRRLLALLTSDWLYGYTWGTEGAPPSQGWPVVCDDEEWFAWALAAGRIDFGTAADIPKDAVVLAKGPRRELIELVGAVALCSWGVGKCHLFVPGVPEAKGQVKAMDAPVVWKDGCAQSNGEHGVFFYAF